MKKYRLNVAFGDYKVGEVFEANINECFLIGGDWAPRFEIAHMLHTGFLSEVVDEVWPQKGDKYWYMGTVDVYDDVWNDSKIDHARRDGLGVYPTEQEAEAMFKKLQAVVKGGV